MLYITTREVDKGKVLEWECRWVSLCSLPQWQHRDLCTLNPAFSLCKQMAKCYFCRVWQDWQMVWSQPSHDVVAAISDVHDYQIQVSTAIGIGIIMNMCESALTSIYNSTFYVKILGDQHRHA